MWAYVVRRLWQMIPTMLGVVLLVFVLFNLFGGDPAYVLAGKISNPRADRQHPAAARRRPAVLRPARDLPEADRDRRLRRVVEHQREGVAHPGDAPRTVDDGAGARCSFSRRSSRSGWRSPSRTSAARSPTAW